MDHDHYPDAYIRSVLESVKTIALVGASLNEARPSYFVFKYLMERGYTMYPVNPGQAGKTLLGQPIHARLADIPSAIDMVDMFRASDAAPGLLDEMLALASVPKVLWMQLGVRHDATAARAESAGIQVVMDRCPKIEYGRLSSEISWMGVNSRTLSARRAPLSGAGFQRLSLHRESLPGGEIGSQTNKMPRDNPEKP